MGILLLISDSKIMGKVESPIPNSFETYNLGLIEMAQFFIPDGEMSMLGGEKISAHRFKWKAPIGKFQVTFLCPIDEPGPRRLWIEPVISGWSGNSDTHEKYLVSACRAGLSILSTLEEHTPTQKEMYKLSLAIFQNRLKGNDSIERSFHSLIEFLEIDSAGREATLLFGSTGNIDLKPEYSRSNLLRIVKRLLKKEMPQVDNNLRSGDVISHLQSMYGKANTDVTHTSWTLLPGANEVDILFLDSAKKDLERLDPVEVTGSVMSAMYAPLIESPVEVTVEEMNGFVDRFRQVFKKSNREEFDRWLKNAMGQSFRNQLPTKLSSEVDREKGRMMYSALRWGSIRLMARAYGALMLFAHLHIKEDSGFKVTSQEQLLFRRMHFPQLFLAGLPLAFLRKNQFRWIARPLIELWNEETWDGKKHISYAHLADFLKLYGTLVSRRRELDRERKGRKQIKNRPDLSSRTQKIQEIPEESQQLTSIECPKCNSKKRDSKLVFSAPPIIYFTLTCPKCGFEQDYHSSTEVLSQFSDKST